MYRGRVAYPERELCILRTWGPHMCDMSCSLGLASSQNAPGKALDAMSPTRCWSSVASCQTVGAHCGPCEFDTLLGERRKRGAGPH